MIKHTNPWLVGRNVVLQVAAVYIFVVAVATAFLFFVPARGPGTSVISHILINSLFLMPVILLMPSVWRLYRANAYQWVGGGALVVIAILYAYLSGPANSYLFEGIVRHMVTGIAEEVVFRGYIYTRLAAVIKSTSLNIVVNGLLFVAFHIPLVIASGQEWWVLLPVAGWGILYCTLRQTSKGLTLPSSVHAAANISQL